MTNPWLDIPLADYEGHMSLPTVAQADLLAETFAQTLRKYAPESVALPGCAGGNGLDRIDSHVTKRVVGIDINPEYVEAVRARFSGRIPGLELLVADLQSDGLRIEPVDVVFAALLLEYVEIDSVLGSIRRMLKPHAMLVTVLQLPGECCPDVTPSPFTSLQRLAPCLRLVLPEYLLARAAVQGFQPGESFRAATPFKAFHVQAFIAASRGE
jgi:ubiquinone/menaquinone biosynthesis C-methylase UbiE